MVLSGNQIRNIFVVNSLAYGGFAPRSLTGPLWFASPRYKFTATPLEAEDAKNQDMHFQVRKYSPKCFSFWVTSYPRRRSGLDEGPQIPTWLRPGPHKGLHHPDPFAFSFVIHPLAGYGPA